MELNGLLDPEWQRISAIKNLFDSPGWKIFEEKINDLLECEKSNIENLSSSFLKAEQLEEFNASLSKKKCYEQILLLKDELLEENSPAQDASGEQNTLEMS